MKYGNAEVEGRSTEPDKMMLQLTTGLGITGSAIVYGNELLNYFQAFGATGAVRDENATFQTIGLRIPDAA